jgi:hypothetical protein
MPLALFDGFHSKVAVAAGSIAFTADIHELHAQLVSRYV